MEVEARRLGWDPVKPPRLAGKSGTEHTFTFLAASDNSFHAFDIYDSVSEIDMLKTFVKKFDSSAGVDIVCISGEVSAQAVKLAREYQINILKPDEVENYMRTALVAENKVGEG